MNGLETVNKDVEERSREKKSSIPKLFAEALPEANGRQIFKEFLAAFSGSPPLITQNKKMLEILALCQKIASSKATVLLQGESGTGKELLAKYIHSLSPRNKGPFVAVNCASLPESLLESELFGHEKGAFTGAIAKKIGKFELAHGGTILLDEISEMNTFLQAKILRVLQESEVDRIGGHHPIPIDIRVIATTNRHLETSVQKGEFREDLYYRLNVVNIKIPPLRERPEDVPLLADHYLKFYAQNYGRAVENISPAALAWLQNQEWKGNIRELKNKIEYAVLVTNKNFLDVDDFAEKEGTLIEPNLFPAHDSLCLKDMERRLILRALEATKGNRTQAAKVLGISIRTLRNKLNEYKKGNRDLKIFED
ncbi:MAG: sigma-54 interaction domain-containing protein [Thermodesulfobacteriota bacterium]